VNHGGFALKGTSCSSARSITHSCVLTPRLSCACERRRCVPGVSVPRAASLSRLLGPFELDACCQPRALPIASDRFAGMGRVHDDHPPEVEAPLAPVLEFDTDRHHYAMNSTVAPIETEAGPTPTMQRSYDEDDSGAHARITMSRAICHEQCDRCAAWPPRDNETGQHRIVPKQPEQSVQARARFT